LERVVVVAVGALVPDLDRAAVAARAADPDALRVVAAVAERRGAARADPLVAALVAALLFLEALAQRLHELVPAERRDRGLLLGAQFALEGLAQPVVRDLLRFRDLRHAREECAEGLVEA